MLSQPDPDPLAIFDRPESALDREWAEWISENLPVQAVLASRVLELEDGVVAVAFRAPAVADGSSTEWDPYCLFTADSRDPAQAILTGGNCVLPDELTTSGLFAPIGIGLIEEAIDTLVWGPVGPPRVERDVQLDLEAQFAERSVVDSLAFASFLPSNALDYVDTPTDCCSVRRTWAPARQAPVRSRRTATCNAGGVGITPTTSILARCSVCSSSRTTRPARAPRPDAIR